MFKIIFNHNIEGEMELIQAPIDWKDLSHSLVGSKTYKTITKRFIESLRVTGDIILWIDNIYDTYGYNSEIITHVYVWNNETNKYEYFFYGKINYATYAKDSTSLTFDLLNAGIDERIYSKEDIVVEYSRQTDINGNYLNQQYSEKDVQMSPAFGQSYVIKGVRVFDMFSKIMHVLIGKKGMIKSLVFDYNDTTELSVYKNDILTSGKYARGEFNQGSISFSLKYLFENLCKIYCLGACIEYDGLQNRWFRIDPLQVFYNDQIVLDCSSINNLEISINKEYLYGSVDVGYDVKTSKANDITGFEYNISASYAYNNENETRLNLVSGLRADGTALKLCITETIKEGSEGSYDNDNFIIKTISDINGNLSASGNTDFELISGIDGNPPIFLNMEISPARILENNYPYVMIPNISDAILFFNSKKKQSNLSTEYKLTNTKISENTDIKLDTFEKSWLSPYIAELDTTVSLTEYGKINNNPHGLIRFFDYISNRIRCGWIMESKYQFYTCKFHVILILARDNYFDNLNLITDTLGGLVQFTNGTNINISNG